MKNGTGRAIRNTFVHFFGSDHRGDAYDRQRLAVLFVLKERIQTSAIPVYLVINALLFAEIGRGIDIQLHIVPLK